MSSLATGTRIEFFYPRAPGEHLFYGTVVEVKEGLPNGSMLVCLDKPICPGGLYDRLCGHRYSLLVDKKNIKRATTEGGEARYSDIPSHVGVCAMEDFSMDGVSFRKGATGRVVEAETRNSTVTVSWYNVRNDHFRTVNDGKKRWHNCWSVPACQVRWAVLDPDTHRLEKPWFSSMSLVNDLQKGDYVLYKGTKPVCFPHSTKDGIQEYAVTQGVILQVEGCRKGYNTIQASVAGGMSPNVLGTMIETRKEHVKKFEGDFIPRGRKVRVVSEIFFKKKNLQGLIAEVLLPTDSEGDVGLVFYEDLGAGSLDGAGIEGRCLYLPSSAVKDL